MDNLYHDLFHILPQRSKLKAIVHVSIQDGFLDLSDVYASCCTCLTVFHYCGHTANFPIYCPAHLGYHSAGIWCVRRPPETALRVLQAFFEWDFGYTDPQTSLLCDDIPPEIFNAFVNFRSWQIRHGTAWDAVTGAQWLPPILAHNPAGGP